MKEKFAQFAPGARITARDAEWLVRRVDGTSTGGKKLTCIGISEPVKDKDTIFLTEIEPSIEILNPGETRLVPDGSASYRASLLYIESLLRQMAPTDENLYIGHNAAMDLVPYQLDPALQALRQPRQRILMADAVGLGKTLEAGILVCELIKRGKGKRILVVTVKSMMTQFQKEFWTRFTIPLKRLDSYGIQRIRREIPANHNPFYFYDKTIISIDTLKQDSQYRAYIEKAYWDIIVIDEAHNTADRGTGALRNKLARLLAHRSDTLIMLSATPHDGKARSFAGLMNMLDATAITDPEKYGKEDIKGLFIRRFKKDIQYQVQQAFKERSFSKAGVSASMFEEDVFAAFAQLKFSRLDQHLHGGRLFKTTLEKALFSSPAACIETIDNRVKRLEKKDEDWDNDIRQLMLLKEKLERITPEHFSKYQLLMRVIRDPETGFAWTGKNTNDRLVIFTERIKTMNFLKEQLKKDLQLKDNQIETLQGDMSDMDMQRVVEDFGKENSPVRLLIASDVASEGINLHYLCHRMIHFDIPWSLMVFQQRNGRIDRYGQENRPQIIYLLTESKHPKVRGDMRILEVLIEKDDQAARNIGDPSVFMKVYDIFEEEGITAAAIEQGKNHTDFERELDKEPLDLLALIMGDDAHETPADHASASMKRMPSIFESDFDYLQAGINFYRQSQPIQACFYPEEQRAEITLNADLKDWFRYYPAEIKPADNVLHLSADKNVIDAEIRRARKEETAWPTIQYLWELHPLMEWLGNKTAAVFGRMQAPVMVLPETLPTGEVIFVVSGIIPNRKSHPLLHYWTGVSFINGQYRQIESFESVAGRTGLGRKQFPNAGMDNVPEHIDKLLPEAVHHMTQWMREKRRIFEDHINEKLNRKLEDLERLRDNKFRQLDLHFAQAETISGIVLSRKEQKRREIERVFDEYMDWIQDTMTADENPYIQIIAVLTGELKQ